MTELSRLVPLDRIGPTGLDQVIEAQPAELGSLAARLRVPAVTRLRCEFHLRRSEASVIEASGTVEAEVVQTCVVSLDDFPQAVREDFSIQFVPSGTETDDDDPESPDQIPYEGSALDLGEAAVEQLALALDPYPHKPGAEPPADDGSDATNPFAALAALRPKQ